MGCCCLCQTANDEAREARAAAATAVAEQQEWRRRVERCVAEAVAKTQALERRNAAQQLDALRADTGAAVRHRCAHALLSLSLSLSLCVCVCVCACVCARERARACCPVVLRRPRRRVTSRRSADDIRRPACDGACVHACRCVRSGSAPSRCCTRPGRRRPPCAASPQMRRRRSHGEAVAVVAVAVAPGCAQQEPRGEASTHTAIRRRRRQRRADRKLLHACPPRHRWIRAPGRAPGAWRAWM
jgi:hypothetical protein